MTYYDPFYLKGLPGMGAGATNQIVSGGVFVEQYKSRILNLFEPNNDFSVTQWFGEITLSTLFSANRWLYRIRKINFTITPQTLPNTQASTDNLPYPEPLKYVEAYNLYEYKNTGAGLLADGTPIINIPAGFTLQPVNGIVLVYQAINIDGLVVFLFDRQNGLGGECE